MSGPGALISVGCAVFIASSTGASSQTMQNGQSVFHHLRPSTALARLASVGPEKIAHLRGGTLMLFPPIEKLGRLAQHGIIARKLGRRLGIADPLVRFRTGDGNDITVNYWKATGISQATDFIFAPVLFQIPDEQVDMTPDRPPYLELQFPAIPGEMYIAHCTLAQFVRNYKITTRFADRTRYMNESSLEGTVQSDSAGNIMTWTGAAPQGARYAFIQVSVLPDSYNGWGFVGCEIDALQ